MSSYDFNLPIYINQSENDSENFDIENFNQSPQFSEHNRRTPKHSRLTYVDYLPRKTVLATGLRHAIELSEPKISFKVPIVYLEKLKDGGFYEAKVCFIINECLFKIC